MMDLGHNCPDCTQRTNLPICRGCREFREHGLKRTPDVGEMERVGGCMVGGCGCGPQEEH